MSLIYRLLTRSVTTSFTTIKLAGDGCYLLECNFPSNQELDQFLESLNGHANYKLSIIINKS